MIQENTPLVHRLQQRYLPIFPSKTYLSDPPEETKTTNEFPTKITSQINVKHNKKNKATHQGKQ
jgi:hypothetical protein